MLRFRFVTTNQQNHFEITIVLRREKRGQILLAPQKLSSMVRFRMCPLDWMNQQRVDRRLRDRLSQRVLLARLRLREAPNCLLLRQIRPAQVKVCIVYYYGHLRSALVKSLKSQEFNLIMGK